MQVSDNEIIKILSYCKIERSLLEILTYMGYKDRTKFRRKYITPLIEAGMLELAIPDKPNSRLQKYHTRNTDA